MKIIMFQIDAFESEVYKGNPAAVCVLYEWLDHSGRISQESLYFTQNSSPNVVESCFVKTMVLG